MSESTQCLGSVVPFAMFLLCAKAFITQASTRYQYKHVERVFGGA